MAVVALIVVLAMNSGPSALQPEVSSAISSQPPRGGKIYAVVGVRPDDVLNARFGPGTGNQIRSVISPFAMGVEITGTAQTIGGGVTWAPIRHQESQGWVNTRFLAEQTGRAEPELARRANEAIQALRGRDMQALSRLAHPEKGVRFSPYSYVGPEDLLFKPAEVARLWHDPNMYTWGGFDGSGEPITMRFSDYYRLFAYDVDFAFPDQIGFNQQIGGGNMINNLGEFYPGASFVEYHFPGFDRKYEGMDWRSLRLVFERSGRTWALVGIIHDAWTT